MDSYITVVTLIYKHPLIFTKSCDGDIIHVFKVWKQTRLKNFLKVTVLLSWGLNLGSLMSKFAVTFYRILILKNKLNYRDRNLISGCLDVSRGRRGENCRGAGK